MRRAVERMEELEDDPDAYLEIDVDFHSEIASATGNVVLAFVLDSVRELLRVSRRVTNLINAMPEATVAHRRIYEALLAREPETARQAMRRTSAHGDGGMGSGRLRCGDRGRHAPQRTKGASPDQLSGSHRRAAERGGHPHREVARSMSSDAAAPPIAGAPGGVRSPRRNSRRERSASGATWSRRSRTSPRA